MLENFTNIQLSLAVTHSGFFSVVKLKPTTRLVFLNFFNFMNNKTRRINPSAPKLAIACGCKERVIYDCLNELERAGLIKRKNPEQQKKNRLKVIGSHTSISNIYSLGKTFEAIITPYLLKKHPAKSAGVPLHNMHNPPAENAGKHVNNINLEQPKNFYKKNNDEKPRKKYYHNTQETGIKYQKFKSEIKIGAGVPPPKNFREKALKYVSHPAM